MLLRSSRVAIFLLAALSLPAAEPASNAETSLSVRIPPLSIFRSLREVCIQTGVTAVVDFGAWEANQGMLDLALNQSRVAVRRSPAFTADLPIKEVFARWCAANEGFTATMHGRNVRVVHAGTGELAVQHRAFVNSPLFAELTINQDDDGCMTWGTLASALVHAGGQKREKPPFTFIQLTNACAPWDSWLASACWPVVNVPLTTLSTDSLAQVLERLPMEGFPTIVLNLSTPSTFLGGAVGYNAQRSAMPLADVVGGLKESTTDFRKRYRYTSALASRIDCVFELYRRLSLDPTVIDDVATSGLIATLIQSLNSDCDSEPLLVLLHECMDPILANHISEVVARQSVPVRKRYYFGTLPSPKGIADASCKAHFTKSWVLAAQDPDADIRAFALGSME